MQPSPTLPFTKHSFRLETKRVGPVTPSAQNNPTNKPVEQFRIPNFEGHSYSGGPTRRDGRMQNEIGNQNRGTGTHNNKQQAQQNATAPAA